MKNSRGVSAESCVSGGRIEYALWTESVMCFPPLHKIFMIRTSTVKQQLTTVRRTQASKGCLSVDFFINNNGSKRRV